MSDQKEIETNRYARKTVTVRGLMQGDYDPNAKAIMAEEGIMWDLSGRTDSFEETTLTIKTYFIEGEEIPSGFTTAERIWVLALAESHGLDVGIVEEEKALIPSVPYIKSALRFKFKGDEWTDATDREFNHLTGKALCKVELDRSIRCLILTIEGKCKDDVVNPAIDNWVSASVRHVRRALTAAGFTEGDIDIDCEVIMGAEREAQCDPDLMRSLLTTDQEVVE